MLRIAILGVGWAGTRHVEAIRELGRNVTVHCLVDSNADHLRTKAEELGVQRTYKAVGDALADPCKNVNECKSAVCKAAGTG